MIVNIDDLQRRAKRRLPRAVFHFIEGGAEDERTLRENQAAFQRVALRSSVLVDVSVRECSTTLFGERRRSPLILAPTGMCGMAVADGEAKAARAATETGALFTLSGMSLALVESVARQAPGSHWLQIVVWRDRELTRRMVTLGRDCGYGALVVTVDVPSVGQRERDIRLGAGIPPRVTLRNALDLLLRFRWFLRPPRFTYADMDRPVSIFEAGRIGSAGKGRSASVPQFMKDMLDASVSWKEIDWLRSLWPGPLLIKGIMSAEDARRAVEHGVDGIVVSNHGGRQLDGLPSTLSVLPEVVDAVGRRADVILDGGIRRGTDVLKAMALGAKACMVGRPYLYGLAADGQRGCERAIQILLSEIDRAQALVGCPQLDRMDRSFLHSEFERAARAKQGPEEDVASRFVPR